jgi:hypothetical protein
LKVDLLDPDLGRNPDKGGQFRQGLLQPCEPGRDAGGPAPLALLHLPEGANVPENAVEVVHAADGEKGGAVRGVERDAQFVKPGIDQSATVPRVQHRAIGVEQDVGAAILEIAHHARQILHQHGFANPVQDPAREIRHLVYDAREQVPGEISRRLQFLVGARTGRAEKIAAVRGLQVETDRRAPGGRAQISVDRLMITTRVGPGRSGRKSDRHLRRPLREGRDASAKPGRRRQAWRPLP